MLKKILILLFMFCAVPALADDKPVRVETDAKLEYNKGIDYYSSGQFDEAVDCFRRAIDLEPEYLDAYFNLGMTLDYLKQYEAALSMFRELLDRKPDDYDAVYRAAVVSYKMGLTDQAKEYLAKLPVSNPLYYKGQELAGKMNTDIPTLKASMPEEEKPEKSKPPFEGNYYYEDLPSPTGIVVDPSGNLYVADYSDNVIFRISPTGEKLVYLKTPKLDGPIGLALDDKSNLYIANYNSNTVLKLSASHQLTTLIEKIDKPYYLYVSGGYLFISSQGSNSVLRYGI